MAPRNAVESWQRAALAMRLDVLGTRWFLTALGLLIVNDLYLKHTFPGWLTGKLSDFAGLFVFVLFLAALVPRRMTTISIATAVLFVFWKSTLSQPLIDYWNHLNLLPIARVVDYSDLIALPSIPASRMIFLRLRGAAPRPFQLITAVIALVAILGTSVPPPPSYSYQITVSDNGSSGSIQQSVDETAKRQGFICAGCAVSKPYRRYTKDQQILSTNWDARTGTLFIKIQGANHAAIKKVIDYFLSDLSQRMADLSEAITVEEYKGTFLTGRFHRLLSVEVANQDIPVCRLDDDTDRRLAVIFSRIRAYVTAIDFTDSCTSNARFCSAYWGGRVFGADMWSRSTSVQLRTPCSWGKWLLEVEVRQTVTDQHVDPSGIVAALKTLLALETGKFVTETSLK